MIVLLEHGVGDGGGDSVGCGCVRPTGVVILFQRIDDGGVDG